MKLSSAAEPSMRSRPREGCSFSIVHVEVCVTGKSFERPLVFNTIAVCVWHRAPTYLDHLKTHQPLLGEVLEAHLPNGSTQGPPCLVYLLHDMSWLQRHPKILPACLTACLPVYTSSTSKKITHHITIKQPHRAFTTTNDDGKRRPTVSPRPTSSWCSATSWTS